VKGIRMADGSEALYTITDGVLRLAWYDTEGLPLRSGEPFLVLETTAMAWTAREFALLPGTEFAGPDGAGIDGAKILLPGNSVAGSGVLQLFPNPADSRTLVLFSVPEAGKVTIELMDVLGNLIQVAADRVYSAGTHRETISLEGLPAGPYMVRVSGSLNRTTRLIIAR